MRAPRTLFAYLGREILGYAILGLVAITLVMVTQNLFRFLDEMVSSDVTGAEFLAVAGYLAVMLATYSVPIAFLLGVLLAFSRVSADSEITALYSCGVGLRTLMTPPLALGAAVSVLTAVLVIHLEHEAQLGVRRVVREMAARGGLVQSGEFRRIDDRVVFVRRVDADNHLEGVIISDRSDPAHPLMIFAERGQLSWDDEASELRFQLRDGDIHVDPDDGDSKYRRISFASFDYALDAVSVLGRRFSTLRPREMTMAQLRAIVARARAGERLDDLRRPDPMHYELQLHRRLALPVAPLLFACVGAPLGLERRRGARSWGTLVCVCLVFGYYALLTFGEFLAMQRLVPAGVAAWLPNGAFGCAAAPLLARARRLRS